MTFPRVVLVLSALAFAGFGVAFLVAPVPMAGTIGILLPEPSARIDLRATYGGFEIGLAIFLLWCLGAPDRLRAGLLASALCIGGFGVTRLVALAFDGPVRPSIHVALALELTGLVLSVLAWRAAGRALERRPMRG